MLTFSVITLFPDWITYYTSASLMGRAQEKGIIAVDPANPRNFTNDVHKTVDDTPYGGGPGMVMMCEPLVKAYRSLLPLQQNARTILLSPLGKPFQQKDAQSLSQCDQIVLICGHYEGIDARILELIPDLEMVSLGDFVLTGGELAALSIIDATARLLPGTLGKDESSHEESFSQGLLEYPHYTRPQEFEGLKVPDVLLSGNHKAIADWRHEKALEATQKYRPDLIKTFSQPNV